MTTRQAQQRRALMTALGALGCALVASVLIGAGDLTLGASWRALRGIGTEYDVWVVQELRVPRTLVALVVGVGLGVGGAVMQSLTRNPLAEPGLLGVNAGASLAVVLTIGVLGASAPVQYVWGALAGAAVAALAVYALGSVGAGREAPSRLLLAGLALTASIASVTQGLVLMDPEAFDAHRGWVVGSFATATMPVVAATAPVVAAGLVLAVVLARSFDVLELGDDAARALGVRPARVRMAALGAVTLLCGAATAAAGPIAFVGLAAPHLARLRGGGSGRWVIGASAVIAPALLLGADIIGRVVVQGELAVGVVAAVLGAPVLILIVQRTRGIV